VRADLRDRLKAYKRWVRRVVYDAFARETGLTAIVQMGEAIASLARQQIAFEQHTETRLTVLEDSVGEVTGRLDQAAAVVSSLMRRMTAVEGMVSTNATISDVQAAEISTLVKAIAIEMVAKGSGTAPKGRNPYQSTFSELYRRFRVSSYHNIPLTKYGEVMAWLREYQETLDTHDDA